MIEKIITSINDDKKPQIISWSQSEEDYIVDGLSGLTRYELIKFVEELKRLTEWEE